MKTHVSPFLLAAGLLFGASRPSWAQQNIGDAKIVINDVKGDLPSGNVVPVTQGDNVFLDEAVKSAPDSKANLLLKDNSNVTVGPGSTVKLDRFVYSGPKAPGSIALDITKGTLRFVTGDASKRAYTIWTPNAAIGVRGTILRIEVKNGETKVINEEGVAIVCHRNRGETASVEELRKRRCTEEQRKKGLCGCAELLTPNSQASVSSSSQIAVSEAPVNAISEPIINEGLAIGGLGITPPVAAAGLLGVVAAAAGVSAAESSTSPQPLSP